MSASDQIFGLLDVAAQSDLRSLEWSFFNPIELLFVSPGDEDGPWDESSSGNI